MRLTNRITPDIPVYIFYTTVFKQSYSGSNSVNYNGFLFSMQIKPLIESMNGLKFVIYLLVTVRKPPYFRQLHNDKNRINTVFLINAKGQKSSL